MNSRTPILRDRIFPLQIAAFFALACLLASNSSAQTKWFKYDGNPVLDVGPKGAWDDYFVIINRIILQNSLYQMWYSGSSTRERIGYATSRDGIHWKKHPTNPVMNVTQPWELDRVFWPYVVYAERQYKMWYSARGNGQVGYAISNDGIVWSKHSRNPVLTNSAFGWDSTASAWPSILGPDSAGKYKMWYEGAVAQYNRAQIGFAEGLNEITWSKFVENPVIPNGTEGSWDAFKIRAPRVLQHGGVYEMWYGGGPDLMPRSTGYATSPDGVHWEKNAENPVLQPGPADSWDDEGVVVGDIRFDGRMYFMWYSGFDGSNARGGIAVSPKGTDVTISPSNEYVQPGRGVVRLAAKLIDPTGISFSARIRALHEREYNAEHTTSWRGLQNAGEVELFDDGRHGDDLPGDGLFANAWTPSGENIFFVDLTLRLTQEETLRFEMKKAAVFTTLGPVALDSLILIGDQTPNPGDTLVVKLVLRNVGSQEQIRAVSVSLSADRAMIREVSEISPTYDVLRPGTTATTQGYYRLYIDPDCPVNAYAKMNLSISSAGIPLWKDTMNLRILPPWWRTELAYALYGVVGLVILYGLRRYERKRTLLKHQRELEHVEAEKLRELDQLKSRFFANISHEFRTPLTLLLGPIEKWKEKAEDEDLQKDLGMMQRNARRLLRLINQLLDISKLEAGSMKLQASPGNIVSFARGIAQSFQSVAANKNITLTTESDNEEVELYFDRDKMEKILSNLLSNAFKFTSEGGEVTIQVRKPESETRKYVEIAISDTGIGIPEEQLPHIFDRFYQVDGTQTREQEGTGIGLALVKELVDAHHGGISVKSTIGKGTAITMQLPLGREHLNVDEILLPREEKATVTRELEVSVVNEDTLDRTKEDQPLTADKPTILVVEDNADVRSHIRGYLSPTYKVLEAHNGSEGVRIAIETIPDLIISDVMMPKMDGYELSKTLKRDEKTSHIPIIILTAKAGMESKIEGLETGADDYLIKPFEGKELLARVRNLIEVRRKLREKFERSKVLKPGEIAVTSMDNVFLKKAMAVVEKHMGDEGFSVEEFGKEMNMSRVQLHRKLTALTNQSARDFIRYLRLHRGMDLLKQAVGTVAEVAYSIGFSSPAYFTKCFHEQFGYPPSEVKRNTMASERSEP